MPIHVTAHSYAEWAARPLVEAVGFDTSIGRLNRDRDRIYGARFDARVNNLGIEVTDHSEGMSRMS